MHLWYNQMHGKGLCRMNEELSFYERMRHVCLRIPEGKVSTYGQIAFLCGKPRNARQVGYALRMNLAGQDIPAHRVVNSQGVLSGAASFLVHDLQKSLLEAEGVEVTREGNTWKVDLKRYLWQISFETVWAES